MANLGDLIIANRNFYRSSKTSGRRKILAFLVSNDTYVTSLTMKFAKATAQAAGAETIIIPNIIYSSSVARLIESFRPWSIINMLLLMPKTLLIKFTTIAAHALEVSSGKSILKINIDGIAVGQHIYDYLLTKCAVSYIDKVSFKMRLLIIIELTYFFSSKKIIEAHKNPLVILPDNAYRQGMIFELCKNSSIECLSGLSMTEFSIYHYKNDNDYKNHCRTPSSNEIDRVMSNNNFKNNARAYLDSRTKGEGQQHDVIRAFSSKKKNISSKNLIESMSLCPEKPIVLVATHIFRDAPHAYPNALFNDYTDWLIQTCGTLVKNKKINFIVKEHPSTELYNEDGEVMRILSKIGLEKHLIPSNINTGSLMNVIDVMVTCGGTAAMEFACFGIPSVLAANPPYSMLGFTNNSTSIDEYLCKLEDCHNLNRLNHQQRDAALCSLYFINKCMGARKLNQLIGTQRLFLGTTIDIGKFYEEMIDDCNSNIGYSALVSDLNTLLSKSKPHFFNEPE